MNLLALLFSVNLSAQETIKGNLRSSTGEVLAGATINVKGENKSVVSDANGQFSIIASKGSVLIIGWR